MVIVFIALMGFDVSASYRDLNFEHGNVTLGLRLTARELTVRDRAGVQTLRRAPCNAKVIQKYWADVGRHVARLKPIPKVRGLAGSAPLARGGATLRADDQTYRLGMLDSKLRYFDFVAKTTPELFVAERRACRGRR